jgi:hypothetical protein
VPLLLEISREKAPGDARDLALEELGDELLAAANKRAVAALT